MLVLREARTDERAWDWQMEIAIGFGVGLTKGILENWKRPGGDARPKGGI